MPRHRKECIPKHRALPSDENSGRRVPLNAAIEAAGTALEPARETTRNDESQVDPAHAETVQFDAVRPGAVRPGAVRPGRSRRPPTGGAGGNQQRRMRGLLVTPWFAAGAGFVIAAALALNSPHTVLTYRPNTSKCSTCIPPGALATAKPGVVLKPPKPARTAKASRKSGAARHGAVVAAGSAVGFQVVWNRNGEFAAIVTVPAQQASRGWRLRFEIPGRRIVQVFGARWQPGPGGYGGMASTFSFRPERPGHSGPPTDPGEGLPRRPGVPGGFGHYVPQQLKFLVTAQGDPATPALCVLNGVHCHFG
jgi:hypothetical protein